MNKFSFAAVACLCISTANAQTSAPAVPELEPFGKVSLADLELKACDFEKDANAEVLFEKSNVYFGSDLTTITEEVHKRVKIFNDNGKGEADVKLEYYSGNHLEYITGIQAETINLIDGKVEITRLDKKLITVKYIDKARSAIVFALPNIKPGCIIEYKYQWNANIFTDLPDWYCQEKIPVRYSEFISGIPDVFYFRTMSHLWAPLFKHVTTVQGRTLADGTGASQYEVNTEDRVMVNVPSLPDEPFMSSYHDNVQCIRFQLVSIKPIGGFSKSYSDTWAKVGGVLSDDQDFGGQLRRSLEGEDLIIEKAKALKTDEEKIAFIFNKVKSDMKWNGDDDWYTNDGTSKSWDNKTGNSAEINLILYHLLKKSGVNAYPMVVSTREHGKVDAGYTSLDQFNRAAVYVRLEDKGHYVLDATGKYNMYNETPAELLNSSGLYIDKSKELYDIVQLTKKVPARQIVLISAEIKADGKLQGTAQLSSTSYNRINAIERYKTDGEKKYMDYLRNDDNNLKITSVKFDNMDVDTLPLMQKIDFDMGLTGSDDQYIYLNPNLFTSFRTNPFLSENRLTDIDFGYLRNYSINGVYKTPPGYKIEALPKSISMMMPDSSFSFKRIIAEQDGAIMVHYVVNYNVPIYPKDHYDEFYAFFKKMYELLNEQIVLKKS